MRVVEMASHVRELCEDLRITVVPHASGGRAWRRTRKIAVRPVKTSITYADALHEIGHVVGPWQSQPRLASEAGAWKWAMENAKAWTDAMERTMVRCLGSYLAWQKRHATAVLPPEGHPAWEILRKAQ